MKKLLHYELILGVYKINHIKTRKMALLPVTFLVLEERGGNSLFKKENNLLLQNLLRQQIVSNPSMNSAFFDFGTEVDESMLCITEVRLYYKKRKVEPVDVMVESCIMNCFDNMFIEVIDPDADNGDYFVFSPNRRWNLIALRYALQPENPEVSENPTTSILELAFDGIFNYKSLTTSVRKMRPRNKVKADFYDVESVYQDSYVSLRKEMIDVPMIDSTVIAELNQNPNLSIALSEDQWATVDWALYTYYGVGLDEVVLQGDEYTNIDRIRQDGRRSFVLVSAYESMHGVSLASVPLIEIQKEKGTEESKVHFLWSAYTPFYLNTLGVVRNYEIRPSIPLESIWCLFHITPNNKVNEKKGE